LDEPDGSISNELLDFRADEVKAAFSKFEIGRGPSLAAMVQSYGF